MHFVGWVPCITGRLSFSRAGAEHGSHKAHIANRTLGADGYLVGTEWRRSRDAPFPDFFMHAAGRIEGAHFFTVLAVEPAALPVVVEHGAPTLIADEKGALVGEVIIAVGGGRQRPDLSGRAKGFSVLARAQSLPSAAAAPNGPLLKQARDNLGSLWLDLKDQVPLDIKKSDGFAKASVIVSRSGRCDIVVRPEDIFTSESIKLAQVDLMNGRMVPADLPSVSGIGEASAFVARQVFFFIRDLLHKHYHHSPHSDLATTTYIMNGDDDQSWRRDTLYGLIRLAVTQRREGHTGSLKQVLGIVSYAESFQRHQAGWRMQNGSPAKASYDFEYDFGALRASVEASISKQEHDEDRNRNSRYFGLATLLTFLGIMLGGAQIWNVDKIAFPKSRNLLSASNFWGVVHSLILHPVAWGFAATIVVVFGLTLDRRFFDTSNGVIAWRSGVARFADAMLGSLSRRVRSGLIVQVIVQVLLAFLVFALLALATLAALFAHGDLSFMAVASWLGRVSDGLHLRSR